MVGRGAAVAGFRLDLIGAQELQSFLADAARRASCLQQAFRPQPVCGSEGAVYEKSHTIPKIASPTASRRKNPNSHPTIRQTRLLGLIENASDTTKP
jgi:hypothetical protein